MSDKKDRYMVALDEQQLNSLEEFLNTAALFSEQRRFMPPGMAPPVEQLRDLAQQLRTARVRRALERQGEDYERGDGTRPVCDECGRWNYHLQGCSQRRVQP